MGRGWIAANAVFYRLEGGGIAAYQLEVWADHSKHDLLGLAIEQVRSKDLFVIKAREHKYIQLFDSYRRGLNQEP